MPKAQLQARRYVGEFGSHSDDGGSQLYYPPMKALKLTAAVSFAARQFLHCLRTGADDTGHDSVLSGRDEAH